MHEKLTAVVTAPCRFCFCVALNRHLLRLAAMQVNAVVYVGDGRSREVIRAFEFPGSPSNRSRSYGFEAIITTYELVLKVSATPRMTCLTNDFSCGFCVVVVAWVETVGLGASCIVLLLRLPLTHVPPILHRMLRC